ncbi:hypothetical protein [Streptomyces sp. NPDC018967]|uniref:wHTH domain-containing protein n=1 Tax=Streptomyces sp. NPDC018967 TaxID=3365059 RepID=UPI003789D2B3
MTLNGGPEDWLLPDCPVRLRLTHVLSVADHLRRTPTAAARRLHQLGHTLPPDVEFTTPNQPDTPPPTPR